MTTLGGWLVIVGGSGLVKGWLHSDHKRAPIAVSYGSQQTSRGKSCLQGASVGILFVEFVSGVQR